MEAPFHSEQELAEGVPKTNGAEGTMPYELTKPFLITARGALTFKQDHLEEREGHP